MTPLFPAKRAAEEFDQVLGGTATQAVTDRYAELLDTVVALREQPEVMPRADFVGDLRSRLMTAAETELVAAPAVVRQLPTTPVTHTRRRLGTVAATLVIVGGTAGMAAAASGALPGEPLYPIKRGVEQVTTAVRLDDAARGKALLDQADNRLAEVEALQAQSDPDPALIATTVDAFRAAADEGSAKLFTAYQSGGDTADIETVRTFTAQQMADVASMSTEASPALSGVLVDAADTLADIDQQARVLCGACDAAPALTPPQALSAGAVAATVTNLLQRPATQAKADIEKATADRAAYFAALQARAEETAGKIPKGLPGSTGTTTAPPVLSGKDNPVTSTITKDGRLLPSSVATGVAVKDLLTGVTSSVTALVTTIVPPTTPLGEGVKGLTDAVDETVDKTVNGLIPTE